MSAHTVVVKILEKDYQVACPPEQEPGLIEAARYLDKQMRGVRDSGKVIGLERIAVMVALNVAYDLLHKANQASEGVLAGQDEVKKLSDRVEDALQRFSQMEIG